MQSKWYLAQRAGCGLRLDNGNMKLLGFQIPNYTFPGVTIDGLIFNMPHREESEAIELAGTTLAGLRQPARAR